MREKKSGWVFLCLCFGNETLVLLNVCLANTCFFLNGVVGSLRGLKIMNGEIPPKFIMEFK